MEWHHIKPQLSAGKIMASVFWDLEGVIHIEFLLHGVTINEHHYSNLLCNDVHQVIWEKRPGKLSKIILLHDSTHPHTENLTKVTLVTMGWEIMNHPPYSPDLGPSDLHMFGLMKVHLEGQKLQTGDELR
jgi:histone-lysine N-methyltransferase SETMAR